MNHSRFRVPVPPMVTLMCRSLPSPEHTFVHTGTPVFMRAILRDLLASFLASGSVDHVLAFTRGPAVDQMEGWSERVVAAAGVCLFAGFRSRFPASPDGGIPDFRRLIKFSKQ